MSKGPIVIAGASGLFSSGNDRYRIPIEEMAEKLKEKLPHAHVKTFIWNQWRSAYEWIGSFGSDAQVFIYGHSNGVYFALKIAEALHPRKVAYVGSLDKHIDLIPVVSPPAGANVENLTDLHATLDWVTRGKDFTGHYYAKDFDVDHVGILYVPEATNRILADIVRLAGQPEQEEPDNVDMFEKWTPTFMKMLMADFDLSVEDAAAVFGNAGHESIGYSVLQEIKPTVPGSRGGYGIMQWTGPRRRAFEAYCAKHGYDPSDMITNYKHLFNELKSDDEKGVLPKLKAAPTLEAKVKVFSDTFLRPGIPHMASRQKWAQKALDAYYAAQVPDTTEPPETLPELPVADYTAHLQEHFPSLSNEDAEKLLALAYVLKRAWPPGNGQDSLSLPNPAIEPGFSLSQLGEINMGNYSKLIGSLVGGILSFAAAKNFIPPEWNSPEITSALTVLGGAFATWLFPPNQKSA